MVNKGPEGKFRTKTVNELKKYNAKVINNVQYMGETKSGMILSPEPGVSDITLIHPYTGIIFLEFKSINGKLSAVQKRFLEEINLRVPYSGFVAWEDLIQGGILRCSDGISYGSFNNGGELIDIIRSLRNL